MQTKQQDKTISEAENMIDLKYNDLTGGYDLKVDITGTEKVDPEEQAYQKGFAHGVKAGQNQTLEWVETELNIRASAIESTLLEYDNERLDAQGELIMDLRQLLKERKGI